MAQVDHVLLLMIQILEEFLRVLMIEVQFYVQGHEFFPENRRIFIVRNLNRTQRMIKQYFK